MSKYSATFKKRVIEKAEKWDNVSRAAKEHNVSRRILYSWMDRRDEIEEEAALEEEQSKELVERREHILDRIEKYLPDTIDSADKYLQMLKERGTVSERKQMLNGIVEGTLWQIVQEMEGRDLSEVHIKDLSRIMTDLEKVREKLAGEPTIIIEERNKMKELVVIAAKELFGEDKTKDLVHKIETMAEAEYTEVG